MNGALLLTTPTHTPHSQPITSQSPTWRKTHWLLVSRYTYFQRPSVKIGLCYVSRMGSMWVFCAIKDVIIAEIHAHARGPDKYHLKDSLHSTLGVPRKNLVKSPLPIVCSWAGEETSQQAIVKLSQVGQVACTQAWGGAFQRAPSSGWRVPLELDLNLHPCGRFMTCLRMVKSYMECKKKQPKF